MRWDELFADLEAQLESAAAAELAGEVADRTRRLAAEVTLADRLRGARGRPVRLSVPGGPAVAGLLREVGADWLLVADEAGREVLVVSAAVLAAAGLPREHTPETSLVRRRLGLGSALRGVARDRSAVTLRLQDGAVLTGTIDRVGRDFLELAEHPVGEPRRAGQVSGVRAVAFGALATVTRTA
jgi:hypothetical protein